MMCYDSLMFCLFMLFYQPSMIIDRFSDQLLINSRSGGGLFNLWGWCKFTDNLSSNLAADYVIERIVKGRDIQRVK